MKITCNIQYNINTLRSIGQDKNLNVISMDTHKNIFILQLVESITYNLSVWTSGSILCKREPDSPF